jgi:hypothetical protein
MLLKSAHTVTCDLVEFDTAGHECNLRTEGGWQGAVIMSILISLLPCYVQS